MHPIQMQEGNRGSGMGYTAFINRLGDLPRTSA